MYMEESVLCAQMVLSYRGQEPGAKLEMAF